MSDVDVDEPLRGFDWAARAAGIVVAAALVAMSMAGGILASRPTQPNPLPTSTSAWFDLLSSQTTQVGQLCDQASQLKVPVGVSTDSQVKVGNERLAAAVKNNCSANGTLATLRSALQAPQLLTPKSYADLSSLGSDAMIEMQSSLSFLGTAISAAQLQLALANYADAKRAADPLIAEARTVYDYSQGNVADESTRSALLTQLTACEAASSITSQDIGDVTAATIVLQDCKSVLQPLIAAVQMSQQIHASMPVNSPTPTPTPTPTPSPQRTAPPSYPVYYGDTPVITNVTLIADDGNSITVGVTVADPDYVGYNLCVGNGSVQAYRYTGQRGTNDFAVRFKIGNAPRSPWAMLC